MSNLENKILACPHQIAPNTYIGFDKNYKRIIAHGELERPHGKQDNHKVYIVYAPQRRGFSNYFSSEL